MIVGFTLGAGSLLVLDQLKNLLGLRAVGDVHDHFLVRFWRSLFEGGPLHAPTAAIGLGSIALVLALRWLKGRLGWRLLPDLLLVVIAMAAVVGWLGLDAQGVKVVGEIPAALPSLRAIRRSTPRGSASSRAARSRSPCSGCSRRSRWRRRSRRRRGRSST